MRISIDFFLFGIEKNPIKKNSEVMPLIIHYSLLIELTNSIK